MKKETVISLIIACLLLLSLILIANWLSIVLVFIPAVIAAFIIQRHLLKHDLKDIREILPLYLLALGIQFLHFAEEYLTGFPVKVAALFGIQPYSYDYWVAFNMVAYFIFILGGIIIYNRISSLFLIPILFVVAGVLFNAAVHIGTSIYLGAYFPGLFTAITYVIIGPVIAKKTINLKNKYSS